MATDIEAGVPSRTPVPLASHLADIVVGTLIASAIMVLYAHHYAPFAQPSGPVNWLNLLIVPYVFRLDLRAVTGVLERPPLLAVMGLPFVLTAAWIAIARSRIRRWIRILLYALVSPMFVFGSIAVPALLRLMPY